jgi:MFS superfamily sulfate permease-like transporter
MLILGIIIGILISILTFTVLAFFRAGIEKRVRVIETVLSKAGPKAKGYVFEPEDESDLIRQERIKENSKNGRDTPLSELM